MREDDTGVIDLQPDIKSVASNITVTTDFGCGPDGNNLAPYLANK